MEIRLLAPGYKNNDAFYKAFLDDELMGSEFVSEESIWIPYDIPDFPIYFSSKDENERENLFVPVLRLIDQYVISLDRDYFMNERFWHSLFCLYKRDYLISCYPMVKENIKKFNNIIIKPFDWENYMYKGILIAQYVADHRPGDKEKYYHLILHNMDMFNYIIKYEIFRNGIFLLNIMDIIDETGLSDQLKAKIKDRPELGADVRYGRRVIYEFNRSYPIVMSPMMDKDTLKQYFLEYLSYYVDVNNVASSEETEKQEEIAAEPLEVVQDDTHEEIMNPKEECIEDELAIGVTEEMSNEVMASVEGYKSWLRDNEFMEKVIDQYVPVINELKEYYDTHENINFFSILNAEQLKEDIDALPYTFHHGKSVTAIKYYLKYIEEIPCCTK